MLLDANILLYAVDETSPHFARASTWLTDALTGHRRIGLPWQTIGAFVRISTHPRVTTNPLSSTEAWSYVERWLAADPVWIPAATARTAAVLGDLVERHVVTGNLVPDAMLAALAMEHGLGVASADSDFARFPEIVWHNPITP